MGLCVWKVRTGTGATTVQIAHHGQLGWGVITDETFKK